MDTLDSATSLGLPVDVRDYSPAARVLKHLRVQSVRLMSNNPDKIAALESNGISVTARVPLLMTAERRTTSRYLTAKRDRLGHDLPQVEAFTPFRTPADHCFPSIWRSDCPACWRCEQGARSTVSGRSPAPSRSSPRTGRSRPSSRGIRTSPVPRSSISAPPPSCPD